MRSTEGEGEGDDFKSEEPNPMRSELLRCGSE